MSVSSASHLAEALEQARRDVAERDRRILHLKALFDAARELSVLDDPYRILSTFLLMGMGPLGASVGFALSMEVDGTSPRLAHRGLDEAAAQALTDGASSLAKVLFGEGCVNVEGRVEIMDAFPGDLESLPDSLCVLVRWCGPGDQGGLLGLGGRVGACVDGAGEREFLARLTGILVTALRRALAEVSVRHLSGRLLVKNAEYEQAMELALQSGVELDRRIFHLNTLYEANGELSGIVETRGILDTFLLTVMGAFSARRGGVYLHGKDPQLMLRGGGGQDDAKAVMKGLARFFESTGERDPIPMTARVLRGDKVLSGASFPFTPKLAVAFAVDAETQGLLAVGEALDGREYGPDERDLLRALTGNALVFIKNARFFEEITELNRDLTRRNEDLNALLEEVSQCKLELSDVERAREKILDVIRRETTRSSRVRRADFVFILLVPLLVGLVFNFSNPSGVRMVPEAWSRPAAPVVDVRVARDMTRSGALVVDARPADFYRKAHIRDALNVPRSLFDFVYSMRLAELPADTPILVYGRTVSRHYDEDVAWLLKRRDFTNVRVLDGGFADWESSGYPVRRRQ